MRDFFRILLLSACIFISVIASNQDPTTFSPQCLDDQKTCVVRLYETYKEYQGFTNTWMETNLNLTEKINKLSICFNLHLTRMFRTGKKSVHVIFDISPYYLIYVHDNHLMLSSDVGEKLVRSSLPIKMNSWLSVCVVLGNSLQLFVDGIESTDSATKLNNPFEIGMYKLSMGLNRKNHPGNNLNPIALKFSAPLIFTVSAEQSNNLHECKMDVWRPYDQLGEQDWHFLKLGVGELYPSIIKNFSLEAFGVTINSEINCKREDLIEGKNISNINITADDICSNGNLVHSHYNFMAAARSSNCIVNPETIYVIIEGEFSYEQTKQSCKLLKGEIVSELATNFNSQIQELMMSFSIPVTLLYLKRNDRTSVCNALSVQSGVFSFVPLDCNSTTMLANAVCEVNSLHPFYFRTYKKRSRLLNFDPLVTGSFDDVFFINREPMGSISFRSSSGAYLKDLRARDYDFQNGVGFQLILRDVDHPYGKNSWSIPLPESGELVFQDFIFTGCGKNEFTCFTGDCVSLDDRCNGNIDCNDGSDEDCKILQPDLAKDSTIVRMPPSSMTPLKFTIRVVRVQTINDMEHAIQLRLQFITSWKDGRLYFSHLQPSTGDNVLTSKIWKPTFKLTNILFEDWREYFLGNLGSDKLNVIRERPVEPLIAPSGQVELMYNGETDASIIRTEEFVAGFICDLQLYLFPFDVHECQLNISVINKGSSLVYFNISEVHLISESVTLTRFIVSKLHFDFNKYKKIDTPTTLSFSIILERRYASYFFTSFMPCILMGILGFLSHAFDVNNFSDRVTVTISCLIVLTSMFAHLSYRLPDSSVPKALEVFFFFSIIKLSYMHLVHTVMRVIRYQSREVSKELNTNNLPGQRHGSTIIRYWPGKQLLIAGLSNGTIDKFFLIFGLGCECLFLCIFIGCIVHWRNQVYEAVNFAES